MISSLTMVRNKERRSVVDVIRVVGVMSAVAAALAMNPYEELGVSSRASADQIKKAYRKLAREWHPDRNKAEGANEKFMRINEAYETLSDSEKRSEYDNFGRTAGQSQGGGGGGGGGFHEFFQHGSPFSGFHGFGGFRFDGGGQQRRHNAKDRVTMQQFLDDIEGGRGESSSSAKPYLFFVTGTMCFMCMQLEPIWEQAAAELKAASYGVGRVLGDVDQALARRLGVRQLPEIVAFVNGEAVSMKVSRYDVRGILDFASDSLTTASSLPSSSSTSSSAFPAFADVRVLESSSAFDSFVSGWQTDNLVRTLFIGPRTTLRFSVPCFAMRKRHLCAFVHSSQPWILDKGIYSHLASERLVVLLEDAKSPAASVTANRISVETIRQTMRDNRWLLLPRLSSQTVLDELCPVSLSSGDKRNDRDDNDVGGAKKTFCVVLLTRRDDARGRRSVDAFRKFARDFKQNHSHHHQHHLDGGGTPNIHFAYMFKTTQGDFFEALEKRKRPPIHATTTTTTSQKRDNEEGEVGEEEEEEGGAGVEVDPIALLWRHSAEGLRFSWAPRGWASHSADVASDSQRNSFDATAADAAAADAAAMKRQRKKLIRQCQSSLSAFIVQILSTPSRELDQHLIAASSIPRLWDEHQGNLLVRGWRHFTSAVVSSGRFLKICLSYLLGSEDVWFSYFTLFLTLSMIYLASSVISTFMDAESDAERKKANRKKDGAATPSSSSSSSTKAPGASSSFWKRKRAQQRKRKPQRQSRSSPSDAILDGTSIQLLNPDLYERSVLEARGLGVRVLVLVVPNGLYGDDVSPRQGWWAYPSAPAGRRNGVGATSIHAKLASQYHSVTEPLLRQDRRLVLTLADQLLHADWLHDLIDPVLDRNGIAIPELPPVGLCLALHGARRYFSLYWPPGDDNEDDAGGGGGGGGGGEFLGMNEDSPCASRGLDLQTFGAWLERLMEGQLPRLHVETWPEDLATEEKENDEGEEPEED